MYCRVEVPGLTSALNLNENLPKTDEYWYSGDGLATGQCGVTIGRMADRHNGQFKCSLGFKDELKESEGTSKVTVASKG
jgi:hypothetical protein